jgi:hypothetical protein
LINSKENKENGGNDKKKQKDGENRKQIAR